MYMYSIRKGRRCDVGSCVSVQSNVVLDSSLGIEERLKHYGCVTCLFSGFHYKCWGWGVCGPFLDFMTESQIASPRVFHWLGFTLCRGGTLAYPILQSFVQLSLSLWLALGVCYSWHYPTWEITEKKESPVASFYLFRSLLALGAGSFTNTDIGVDYLLDSAIEVRIASLVSWLPAWEESTQLWLQKPMKYWSANWFLIVVGSSRRLFTWWLVKQNQRDSNYFPVGFSLMLGVGRICVCLVFTSAHIYFTCSLSGQCIGFWRFRSINSGGFEPHPAIHFTCQEFIACK